MSEVHYCRLALPKTPDGHAHRAIARVAMNEVLEMLERRGVDPATGQFRITYNLDSTLERTFVLAEWRPNT